MTADDFRALTHVLSEACLLVTAHGDVVGANPAAERLLARDRPLIEGARLVDLVTDAPDDVRAYLRSAARTRGPISGALTFRGDVDIPCTCLGGLVDPPGQERPRRLFIRVRERAAKTNRFRLLNDQVDRLTREVRRRLAAEREQARLLEKEGEMRAELERRTAELERSRVLLEESQRSARVGSWEWDVRSGVVTWSDEMYRIYGLAPGEGAIDLPRYLELIHSEDRRAVEETIDCVSREGGSFSIEHRAVTPTGAVRVIHGRGRAVTDEGGVVVRMIGSGQDVTERKTEEERTRFLADAGHVLTSSLDYQQTLRRIAEMAVPGVADWAAVDVVEDGVVRRVAIAHPEPGKRALAEEAARRWPSESSDPHGVAEVHRTGQPLLLPEITDDVLVAAAKSEEHLAILRELDLRSCIVVPMKAAEGVLGSLALVAGASGRRYGDEDLEFALQLADRAALAVENARLYRAAQEASRARDDLIAIVSHDLRSPLNVVLAGASLLLDIPLEEEKREEQYRAIKRAAERMERLTRDLLDIARIEAGHLRIEPAAEDPRSLVEEALDAASPTAAQGGISLSLDGEERLPRVRAERPRVLQVLDNLLANALRHTPRGGRVTVAVDVSGDAARFRVSDTGTGIPEDLRDHVFDRYYQAKRSDHGGAGLGLPIAKGIIDAHGGRIWLADGPDVGTTFCFTLPLEPDGKEDRATVA